MARRCQRSFCLQSCGKWAGARVGQLCLCGVGPPKETLTEVTSGVIYRAFVDKWCLENQCHPAQGRDLWLVSEGFHLQDSKLILCFLFLEGSSKSQGADSARLLSLGQNCSGKPIWTPNLWDTYLENSPSLYCLLKRRDLYPFYSSGCKLPHLQSTDP